MNFTKKAIRFLIILLIVILHSSLIFQYGCKKDDTIIPPTGKFTDSRDGITYNWIKIGNQTWMAENLAYLPSVSPSDTGSKTASYYYVFSYEGTDVSIAKDTSYYKLYGVLYNWPASMNEESSSNSNPSGVQGVCPTGWHLPSDTEWKELEMYIGMAQSEADTIDWRGSVEGDKLKEAGTIHWLFSDTLATNSSGFTGLPGGHRYILGGFYGFGSWGSWWSSTEASSIYAWFRALDSRYSQVARFNYDKGFGRSVRCVRD